MPRPGNGVPKTCYLTLPVLSLDPEISKMFTHSIDSNIGGTHVLKRKLSVLSVSYILCDHPSKQNQESQPIQKTIKKTIAIVAIIHPSVQTMVRLKHELSIGRGKRELEPRTRKCIPQRFSMCVKTYSTRE